MKKKRLIVSLIILCFLSVASTSWSDKDYLYPSDNSIDDEWNDGTASTDCYTEINDDIGSQSDSDYCATTGQSASEDFISGNLTNTSIGGSDTINWFQVHYRGEESGGEPIRGRASSCDWIVNQNTSWTSVSGAQETLDCLGGSLTISDLDALVFDIEAYAQGKDTGVSWRVSWFYVEVDYTPAGAGRTRRIGAVTWIPKEERIFNELQKYLKKEKDEKIHIPNTILIDS